MLTLYQAERCPYSSAGRQRLTELGIDFVAKQVAPRQKDRKGKHEIPLLTNGDGERSGSPRTTTRAGCRHTRRVERGFALRKRRQAL